jgi:hypothetical protein
MMDAMTTPIIPARLKGDAPSSALSFALILVAVAVAVARVRVLIEENSAVLTSVTVGPAYVLRSVSDCSSSMM